MGVRDFLKTILQQTQNTEFNQSCHFLRVSDYFVENLCAPTDHEDRKRFDQMYHPFERFLILSNSEPCIQQNEEPTKLGVYVATGSCFGTVGSTF